MCAPSCQCITSHLELWRHDAAHGSGYLSTWMITSWAPSVIAEAGQLMRIEPGPLQLLAGGLSRLVRKESYRSTIGYASQSAVFRARDPGFRKNGKESERYSAA